LNSYHSYLESLKGFLFPGFFRELKQEIRYQGIGYFKRKAQHFLMVDQMEHLVF
jgi:hypothetical protein